ncbi:MAG TPA: YkgJ family cysteine cluster protein [Alphaproteobacteria bacterium]|nr:YkgJ family cysteine cluster protein [Alphaproteobacteria bacterium]
MMFAATRRARRLRELERRIPEMDCIPGCTDCCGQVPWSLAEWARVKKPARERNLELAEVPSALLMHLGLLKEPGGPYLMPTKGGNLENLCVLCPFTSSGGCAIHEDRPITCRLFGTVNEPGLACPHGRAPSKKLSSAETDMVLTEYLELTKLGN